MAATDRGIMYEGAFGTHELGKDAAMTPDTVFWIASMTKAITAAAALQLVERGALQLDTPAADVVPELARMQVLTGFDASGTPQLRAPRRAQAHNAVYSAYPPSLHTFPTTVPSTLLLP
jgi:CubicO group peptidase (beta-lactamase class C family)